MEIVKSVPGRASRNRFTIGAAWSAVSPLPCHPSPIRIVRFNAGSALPPNQSGIRLARVRQVNAVFHRQSSFAIVAIS
jgi:hypothetical protein